jgi:molybdopterin-guanine dinucleotide biosynthesis protein
VKANRYRIVVRGRLSERLGSAFADVTLVRQQGRTVLIGRPDQARLDAVLTRLSDLGIEPLSVEAND